MMAARTSLHFILAALFLGQGTAWADERCQNDPTQCGAESDQITLPVPNTETRHLAVYWPLRTDNHGRALALYRKLVERSRYDMPDEPALMMYLVRLGYTEGNLMMRVKLKQPGYPEEDGWYNLYMPVNDDGARQSGIEHGYPKYMAEMRFEPEPATGDPDRVYVDAVLEDGRTTIAMDWVHDPSAPYSEQLEGVTLFQDFQYGQETSHTGPSRVRTRLAPSNIRATQDGSGSGVPLRGWASFTMDDHPQSWDAFTTPKVGELFGPGEKLSDLVDFSQRVPAAYLHAEHELIFTIDHLGPRPEWSPQPQAGDADGDDVPDAFDNCPQVFNNYQRDGDRDGIGDPCDDDNSTAGWTTNCPSVNNLLPEYPMRDGFCRLPAYTLDEYYFGGLAAVCASFGSVPGVSEVCVDTDGDGLWNQDDNCPASANPDQADLDNDGIGDLCDWRDDSDLDADGTVASLDNCPTIPNFGQDDRDGDGIGDACETGGGAEPKQAATAGAMSLAWLCLLACAVGWRRRDPRYRGR